ncbi:XopG/HopH/AvrPtoH family type III secretion system effector [Ralstonia solanacearum]|uniref:XopG/HopH/AvrPtoH family type III secretion system effector n=2 Tax=Ralstonia solanacearum TaxID=305 RepID=UPI000AF9A284|nr:type III secretion system effector protein [Ralstonia solanacearum]
MFAPASTTSRRARGLAMAIASIESPALSPPGLVYSTSWSNNETMLIQTQYPGIYVATASDEQYSANLYKNEADAALNKIASGRTGNQLLRDIGSLSAKKGRKLTISEIGAGESPCTEPVLTASQLDKHQPSSFKENKKIAKQFARKGTFSSGDGCSAIVNWNPTTNIRLSQDGSPLGYGRDSDESFAVLAHELVHARHVMAGTSKAWVGDRYDPSSEAGKEESRAIGIGKYAFSKTGEPSENSIRSEHDLPLRAKYQARDE